jgi:citrate lyase subunit beta/citryl-CoA lyase
MLYMPAANERAIDKAKNIPADGLIFDLEDSVAPESKEVARANAVAAASSGEYGDKELLIRCNGLTTPWGADDIAAAAQSGAAAVLIPKVGSHAYLEEIERQLDAAGAPSEMSIWAMIETPTAILDVRSIVHHSRVIALVMGNNDLARELRTPLTPDRAALIPHLATAVLATREAGKVILDGVYNDVRNADGFLAEANQGKSLGFDGKTLVHPTQVDPTNQIWAPPDDELAFARRVIAAFEEASTSGLGVITVDGQMIENLHVENARRVLAVADSLR